MESENRRIQRHILVIPSWYPPNGGHFFREQSEALKKRGHKVGVVYVEQNSLREISIKGLTKKYFQSKVCHENGLIVLRVYGWTIPKIEWLQYKLWTCLMVKAVQKYIVKFGKPDLIHAHSTLWGGVVAEKINQKNKIPYVITEHRGRFVLNETERINQKLFKKWHKKKLEDVFTNASKIIVVGSHFSENISKYLNSDDSNKIVNIGNIVKVDYFKPDFNSSLSNKGLRFLCIGSLEFVKGIDILIKGFKKLVLNYPDISLDIIGDGTCRCELNLLIKSLKLENNIKLLGRYTRMQVKESLNKCDYFILLSRYEAFGVVFIEAMSMGRPIIASNNVCSKLVNKDTGISINIDSISNVEKELLRSIDLIRKFDSKKIRQFAIDNFSYDVIFNQIESVYDAILN